MGEADPAAIREAVLARGYCIVEGLVPPTEIERLRQFWLSAFAPPRAPSPIIWTPYLGEPNSVLYHERPSDCLYRSYDFLWNEPLDAETRTVGLRLNRIRNRVVEKDATYGETFAPDRYAVYVTTSYYPAGLGRMAEHRDFTDGRRHWHFVLPLTFKGTDFRSGGLVLIDRAGTAIDVDTLLKPGSVLFYDGNLPHRVDPIVAVPGGKVGRLQMFAIPTFIDLPEASERFAIRLSPARYIKDRLRPLKRRLERLVGSKPA